MNISAEFAYRIYRDALARIDAGEGASMPQYLRDARPALQQAFHSVALAVTRRAGLPDAEPPAGMASEDASRIAAFVSQSIGYVAPTASGPAAQPPPEAPGAARSAQEAVTPQALAVAQPDATIATPTGQRGAEPPTSPDARAPVEQTKKK